MRAGDKSSVVEFEVDRFETKSEWHVISKSMGAAWQSRGETTLQGICDSNPPRKLLWEHESQIRLCRLASLSYSSPYIYIYIYETNLWGYLFTACNAIHSPPPLPSWKVKIPLRKCVLKISKALWELHAIRVYIYMYILARYYSRHETFFLDGSNVFSSRR